MDDIKCLVENMEQQLFELEMLEAMYPGENELIMDDMNIIGDVRKWLIAAECNTNIEFLPPRISFQLKLTFDEGNSNKTLDVSILYPHQYPSSDLMEIYVKSRQDALNRTKQCELNQVLSEYIKENVIFGEVCLISVISWLNENCPIYIQQSKEEEEAKTVLLKKVKSVASSSRFLRLWIYSHHIYSKIKRKDILDLSNEFQLTGFCMPGKPGIVCLEGTENNCNDAWSIIKSWNWKKINVRHQEVEKAEENEQSINVFRRFNDFQEIGFVKNSDTRDYHMDMSEFSKYLDQNNCLYMFKLLFGFDKQNDI